MIQHLKNKDLFNKKLITINNQEAFVYSRKININNEEIVWCFKYHTIHGKYDKIIIRCNEYKNKWIIADCLKNMPFNLVLDKNNILKNNGGFVEWFFRHGFSVRTYHGLYLATLDVVEMKYNKNPFKYDMFNYNVEGILISF
jgi:hypothetical protein